MIDLPTFLRLFQVRGAQIMWFLGAGASRSAGVKTAWDMIWDFKQQLYCSQKKLPLSIITDLSDPVVQRKIQAHFDATGGFPASGIAEEYSAYFEATYPFAKDRRQYLESALAGARPSFGHRALALLIREGLCTAIWTTNFDKLVEDGIAKLFDSTAHLVVADLGEPSKLRRAFADNHWPVLGKLHGDFHSDRLKNTSAELREQDAEMRAALVQACQTRGLGVVGYSGRDASVLDTFREALDAGRGFPGGLFWFQRSGETAFAGVTDLLTQAVALGVEAHVVEVEAFDELMSDLVRFLPATSEKVRDITGADRPRLEKALLRPSTSGTPAIRMEAIPITSWPASCRLVACEIGGSAESRCAIEAAGADVVVARVRAGVIAFGADSEIRRAFEPHGITRFETHAISPNRLMIESGERSLLRDALSRALTRRPGLIVERKGRSTILLPNSGVVRPEIFNSGWTTVDKLTGVAPETSVVWREACAARFDWRLDRLWLLLEPRVIIEVDCGTPEDEVARARGFVRERRAVRRNKAANSLLDGWITMIVGKEQKLRLRAFDVCDGMNAEFELARVTAFSGRSRA